MLPQPSQIRHRVLESADDLEVVELGAPAEHMTLFDHAMSLPNCAQAAGAARVYGRNQRFVFHRSTDAAEDDFGLHDATNGLARAALHSGRAAVEALSTTSVPDLELFFCFVVRGGAQITWESPEKESGAAALVAGDSFCVPAGARVAIEAVADDAQVLHVTLRGSNSNSKV